MLLTNLTWARARPPPKAGTGAAARRAPGALRQVTRLLGHRHRPPATRSRSLAAPARLGAPGFGTDAGPRSGRVRKGQLPALFHSTMCTIWINKQ